MNITYTTLLFVAIILTIPAIRRWLFKCFLTLKRIFINPAPELIFDGSYIDVKAFYTNEFRKVPHLVYINNLDTAKAFAKIQEGHFGKVLAIHQRKYYDWDTQKIEPSKTICKLAGEIIVKFGNEYAEVLFSNEGQTLVDKMINDFADLKATNKDNPNEINIITITENCMHLKDLEIKPAHLDIDLYYNNDFAAIDANIKTRLNTPQDKGIILLHGLPGTGKTTYLRHLIGSLTKKVLFVSPAVAGNLMNPEFIDLLIDNPDSVLVIEDAENIIMDRKYSSNSSVSNLLNLSDGLMSDCLNVQIICTFNNAIEMVDSALMRKGRLIAKYEFGKLDTDKAQRLSDHLGNKTVVTKPMTLAEITNQHEPQFEAKQTQVLGFRREVMTN